MEESNMKIEILGTGCPKCDALYANAVRAVQETGVEAEVVKVTDIRELMKRGVIITPGLSIDGKVKSSGKALGVEEIKTLLA